VLSAQTVDVCPSAAWKDAVFLPDPTDPLYFKNVDVSAAVG
jgi:hypothetical protein